MIEKEDELVCSMNHKLPIYMVVFDKGIEKNQRLLCNECMDNLDSNLNNVMSFKKVACLIEENQKKKVEKVEYTINLNINQINQLQNIFNELKSYIIQQLNQLISTTEEWIISLQQIGQRNVQYSFYEELDNLINQVKITEFDYKPLIAQINTINNSCKEKLTNKLNEFKSFEITKKCEQLLLNIQSVHQQVGLVKQININQENQQFNNLTSKKLNLEFKLIDDLNKQFQFCYSIVFNNNGSIMVSSDKSDIKVWNYTQGRLELSNQFQVHQDYVNCLVYSKKRDCFISGSQDYSIIVWKQISQDQWKYSKQYKQHTDYVQCLILNKNDDQLISGGSDHLIKIWNVNFIKNELNYLYSLDNTANVYSLSLNQSETMFASCAQQHYLIWQKGVKEKWELKCIQLTTLGFQIYFISDQQFIWVTCENNIDQILIFELQNGVFKQNQNQTIELNTNQLCEDDFRNFPIIYNKEQNILIVRHKHHIYFISKVNQGNFKIIGSLCCKINNIYGAMTDNAQYLVFWDGKQNKYTSYELLYN